MPLHNSKAVVNAVDQTNHTFDFSASGFTATAGRKLVAIICAPATITVAPVGWTADGSHVSSYGKYVYSKTAAGGETSLSVTLNGARSAICHVFEFTGLGAAGTLVGSTTGSSNTPTTGNSATTGTKTFLACHLRPAGLGSFMYGQTNAFYPLLESEVNSPANEDFRIKTSILDVTADGTYSTKTRLSDTGTPNSESIIIPYADSSGQPNYTWPNDIVKENNSMPERSTGWKVAGYGSTAIQGFPTQFSTEVGSTVDFKVDSNNNAFTVTIYRLGYYFGEGATEKAAAFNGTPAVQAAPAFDNTAGADASNWTVTASWAVPSTAQPGMYLAKVVEGANISHILFVVKKAASTAPVAYMFNDTTWHAYNMWKIRTSATSGRSLYGENNVANLAVRCKEVSYNRAFGTRSNVAHTYFFGAEWPFLRFMERSGYDITYFSCADIDATPTLLTSAGRKIAVTSGHSEYWTQAMRNAWVTARNSGIHLCFFSGNTVFWRGRWEDSRRTFICYKDTHDGSLQDPVEYTGTWRDTRSMNDATRAAENSLTGDWFKVNGVRVDDFIVSGVSRSLPFWRNTAVASFTQDSDTKNYGPVLGFEWQEIRSDSNTPTNMVFLSVSASINCNGSVANDNGNDYTGNGSIVHKMLLYRTAGGALVFSSGFNRWSWMLDDDYDGFTATRVDADIRQATMNLLSDMGVQPGSVISGLTTPSPASPKAYGLRTKTRKNTNDMAKLGY